MSVAAKAYVSRPLVPRGEPSSSKIPSSSLSESASDISVSELLSCMAAWLAPPSHACAICCTSPTNWARPVAWRAAPAAP